MYLTNSIVKSVVQNNDFARIRLTAAGTKVFTRQEGTKVHEKLEGPVKKEDGAAGPPGVGAQYRILGEGLPVVLPYVDPSRIIVAGMQTLKTLVESYYPLLDSFEESFKNVMERSGETSVLFGNQKGLTHLFSLFRARVSCYKIPSGRDGRRIVSPCIFSHLVAN